MTRAALQHWRIVSVTRTATTTHINTALSGYGWLVPTNCVDRLPAGNMGKTSVYWLLTLRIVKGVITDIRDVRTVKTPEVDAAITLLTRLAKTNSVSYTVRYCDPFDGKPATYDGRSHLLWSELQPHGYERTMEPGIEHRPSLRCEFNLATKRVTSIAAPPLVFDEPTPPRSYAALVRQIGALINAAAATYGRDPREVVRDALTMRLEVTHGA